MAASGDWITPRLWGAALVREAATAVLARGGWAQISACRWIWRDVCRLRCSAWPFWRFYFFVLRREFCFRTAAIATLLLACSAGWLAYSCLALTDLPLAVVLHHCCAGRAAVGQTAGPDPAFRGFLATRRRRCGIGVGCPGEGTGSHRPGAFRRPGSCVDTGATGGLPVVTCLLVAGPWYWLVYARNGFPFIQEFFLKHHLARLYSTTIEHVQPWYFYIPVLLAAVFPWTPLLALPVERRTLTEPRRQFLAGNDCLRTRLLQRLAQQAARLSSSAAAQPVHPDRRLV